MDIRTARLDAGLTQAALAQAAKVPQPNLSAYENGRRSPSPEVLQRIRSALRRRPSELVDRHRNAIHDIVVHYHGAHPRLVGSTARGEDQPGSDLDLLVDFTPRASFLDEVGLRRALSDLLGIDVDVVASDTLSGDVGARMLQDSVYL